MVRPRPTSPRFKLAPLALAITLSLSVPVVHAQASLAQVDVAIGAQPLARALNELARQAGLTLMVQPALVSGKTAPAVSGRLSAREAFDRLLTDSGLVARIDGGAVTIQPAPQGSGIATLAPVAVNAQAERSPTTEGTGSYTARAVTLGKGEQALKDIPQSVSVVTRQLMDEQRLTTIYDTLASTTGVTLQQSPQGGKYIFTRGFELTTVQYDGIPLNRGMYGRASNFNGGMAIYDRAEILRGAAGLLQGGGSPSGAVNLVRKRPLDTPGVAITANAGSWDRYGAQVDASGNLNQEGTLRGRAVVDYEDKHSFIDYVNQRNTTYYGTVEYDLSPRTRINLAASYEEVKGRPFLNGLPRLTNGTDLKLPRSTYTGASWNRQEASNQGLYADLSHHFNDDWKFQFAATHIHEKNNLKYAGSTQAINPTTLRGAVLAARTISDAGISGMDTNLVGKFDAFGQRHEVVLGMNYAETSVNTVYGYRTPYQAIDIYRFNPASVREPSDEEIFSAVREARVGKSQQLGAYSALRLQVADPLKLVLGGRLSWFRTKWDTDTTGTSPSISTTDTRANAEFTPYAGLILALNPNWSAYASYADIFDPQTAQKESGEVLKPVVGANYEVGIKGELLDGRVNTSFAVFRLDQKNRAQLDFNTSPTCRDNNYCYTDSGEVRSQGFDAEVSGEILRGWNMFAGYTFNNTKYLKDVSSEGMSFNTYTPKHMLRVWTTYQLPGALSDLTVGGGVSAQTSAYRTIGAFTTDMSGRAVWNALARYQIDKKWSLALNVNNVFNKRYYSTISSFVNGSYYGDPRNVMLTLRGSL